MEKLTKNKKIGISRKYTYLHIPIFLKIWKYTYLQYTYFFKKIGIFQNQNIPKKKPMDERQKLNETATSAWVVGWVFCIKLNSLELEKEWCG